MTDDNPGTPEASRKVSASRTLGGEKKSLETLTQIYEPIGKRQRLQSAEKALAKTILSLQQGFNGKQARCFDCKQIDTIANLALHHKDGNIWLNHLSNLDTVHTRCNSAFYNRVERASRGLAESAPSDPRLREREIDRRGAMPAGALASGPDSVTQWSAREGEKHDQMRERFNKWIHNWKGSGQEDSAFPSSPFKGPGGGVRRSALAAMAPWELTIDHEHPLGSMQTYTRYIIEDTFAGIFEARKEEGVWMLRYMGPRKSKAQV